MHGKLKRDVAEAISKACKMENVTILKAAIMPDHVHMYVSIPSKVMLKTIEAMITLRPYG